MTQTDDLELARAVHAGDAQAWNTFVSRHGALVLAATMGWCEAGCRVPRSQYGCVLRAIRGEQPEPAEERDHCREGLRVYEWASASLRARLGEYQGLASLTGWLRVALRDLRHDYLDAERGRLDVPAALAEASPLARDVWRLGCREADRRVVAARLGLDDEALGEAEREVRERLAAHGLAWQPVAPCDLPAAAPPPLPAPLPACARGEEVAALVEQRLDAGRSLAIAEHLPLCARCRDRRAHLEAALAPGEAPVVAPPPWVNRPVLDASVPELPAAESAAAGFRAKLFSQPDWLSGLVLGGVVSALLLIVVLPRQEYARPVKTPEDRQLAEAATPLAPALAARLAAAREQLGRGKIDAAVQGLIAVLAARPENQEARWLLASTYDRLGDQARAAAHYRVFLEVHDRARAVEDDRAERARHRLGTWEGMP